MAKSANVNFRMDAELKKEMEAICNEMGITMTSAFTMFAKKVVREKRIPFDVEADSLHFDDKCVTMEELMAEMNFQKLTEE